MRSGDGSIDGYIDGAQTLRQALNAAGKQFEFHVYPNAGHGFRSASLEDPSTPCYAAACDSWTRTIAFYREHRRGRTSEE